MTMTDSKVAAARELLASAAKAADQLENDVRQLVSMRAWEVLGYDNFSAMWRSENGFQCPTHVRTLVVLALSDEGMDTRKGACRYLEEPNGHRTADIAEMAGMTVKPVRDKEGNITGRGSGAVSAVLRQHKAGVPPEHIVQNDNHRWQNKKIEQFGDTELSHRKRPQPRRMGRLPEETVTEGFTLPRSVADEVSEIARNSDTTKADIYRQAITEYLSRRGREGR